MFIKVIHIHFNSSTYSFQVISSPIHLCVFHLPLLFIAYSFKRNSYFLFQHKEKSFGIIVSPIISFSPAFYSSFFQIHLYYSSFFFLLSFFLCAFVFVVFVFVYCGGLAVIHLYLTSPFNANLPLSFPVTSLRKL